MHINVHTVAIFGHIKTTTGCETATQCTCARTVEVAQPSASRSGGLIRNQSNQMPRFDFYCHHCSKKWTDVWVSSIRDAQSAPRACSVCGADMEKLPAAPNFVLKGYRAANNYSSKS